MKLRRLPKTSLTVAAAAVAACFSSVTLSNPSNPVVVNGSATFAQSGNVLTVTNSNDAIINWDRFSIGAGETTHFAQTAASSSVLNRVLASDPSVILGTLSSNGRVWLINPAGILVGAGARIDTAAFVASTLNITNADFLANRLKFGSDGLGSNAGNVVNQGSITTPQGGSVYLLGKNVSNEGIVTTPGGEAILAAGNTVELIDSALPGIKVEITGSDNTATNLGQIVSAAGRIGIAGVIVRNSGTLNASSVVEDGGKVFLRASKDAYVDGAGRIVTTGTTGGSVEVLGERVAVTDQAGIDASGENGGGRVMIGGDWQGKNPDVQNAQTTYFGPEADIKVNATKVGAGGTAVVWADDTTRAYGRIEAKGGAEGGKGGMVETSGKRWLDVAGARVDTRAADGSAGFWLLDPTDITIIASGALNPGFSLTGDTSTISDYDINTALNSTNVSISTVSGYYGSGNITVEGGTGNGGTGPGAATIINTSGGARSLSLVADGAIHVQYGAKMLGYGGSSLDVALKANNSVNVGGLISTRGGNVSIAGNGVMLTNNAYGSGVINATTDGLAGSSVDVDSAYGGRVVIDAGAGAFSMAYGTFIGTTNQSRIVDANGAPTGLVAIGIHAGDVSIDSGATIKLNYASTTTYGGGGDLGFIPTGAGAIGLGDYYGGAFTLDNTELSRLIMPAAGTSNCGTGKEGCRIWIGNVFAVDDPLDTLLGNIPVTSYNIIAHNANFALNGNSVTPKRVQLSTTGTINDYGGLGLQSGHLALIGGAGIGNENDGFSFYGNSLLLTSENGNIVASSTGAADLALRRATAPNGSVDVSAAGNVVLLPYFVGQAESAYSNFTLHAMGDLTLAGSGIEYTLNSAFGTLTETAPSSASIRTLQSTAGTTIELGTMTGNIAMHYGASISGTYGGPVAVAIGSEYGSVLLAGGIRTYGGDVVVAGDTGVTLGDGVNTTAGTFGINTRRDGASGGTQTADADGYGGRILIDADNDRDGNGTFTMNAGAFIGSTNQSNMLNAAGSFDANSAVAIGIIAADVAINASATIKLNTDSSIVYGGGGDIGFLPTGNGSVVLGNAYGGSFTLDNTELSRIIMPSASTTSCGTGQEGCRIWIGNTGAPDDPLVGTLPFTSQDIVVNQADFTLNGATLAPKRVQISTTGTLNDAGTGAYGGYFGVKAGHVYAFGGSGVGNSDNDGMSFIASSVALTSNGSITATSVGGGDLALRRANAYGGIDIAVLSGSVTLLPYFVGQMESTPGDFSLYAPNGNITFAQYGSSYTLTSPFGGSFTEVAPSTATIRAGGQLSLDSGGSIAIAGDHAAATGISIFGASGVSITDGGLTTAGTLSLWSNNDLVFTGINRGVIVKSVGNMSLSANNISATAGNAINTAGTQAFYGSNGQEDISYYGAGISIRTSGSQTIAANGDILLSASSADNTQYGGGQFGGSVEMRSQGQQTIYAYSMHLYGGAAGHDNIAAVESDGGQSISIYGGELRVQAGGGTNSYNNQAQINQYSSSGDQSILLYNGGNLVLQGGAGTGTMGYGGGSQNYAEIKSHGSYQEIGFLYGGSLSIYGGSAGTGNYAQIQASSGDQWIYDEGSGLQIHLAGGTSGGTFDQSNDAGIHLGDINTAGSQHVYAGSISIHGGNATYGGAGIGAENTSGTIAIYVDDDLSMFGGNSSANTNPPASAAYIGAEYGANILLDVGGNLNLQAGTGIGGMVLIGSLNDHANVDISVGGNMTLTGNSAASSFIGTFNSTTLGYVDIDVAGHLQLTDARINSFGTMAVTADSIGILASSNLSGLWASGDQSVSATGNLSITAGSNGSNHAYVESYGGNQFVTAGNTLALYGGASGSSNAAFIRLDTGSGYQSVSANQIQLIAGGGSGSYGNSASIRHAGTGSQSVLLTGSNALLALQGGAGNGVYGGPPDTCNDGNGGTLAACANLISSNIAIIEGKGNSQLVSFTSIGGNMTLTGGSTGTNNQAILYYTGSGTQSVYGAPNISLVAGSGGVYVRDVDSLLGNHAQINNSGPGLQDIEAANLNLSGGSSGTSRAQIYAQGLTQDISTTGNISLTGGSGGLVTSYYGGQIESNSYLLRNATGAVIRGSSSSLQNIQLDVGGNLLLAGGTGISGLAFIGNSRGPVSLNATVYGNVSLSGNVGGALIGSTTQASTATYLNTININADGAVSLIGGSNASYGAAAIGSTYDPVAITINAASLAMTATNVADARIGSSYGGNATYGGSILIDATGDLTMATDTAGGASRIGLGMGTGTVNLFADTIINQSLGSFIYGGAVYVSSLGDAYLRGHVGAPGNVEVIAGGNIGVGTLTAYGAMLHAGHSILDENASATNITASTINLSSQYGGPSGGLAISTDTVGNGSIFATISNQSSYGGIQIRNRDAVPITVALADLSATGSTANFTQYGDLTVGTGGTTVSLNAEDVALLSTGNMTFNNAPSILFSTGGSALIGASGDILLNSNFSLYSDGDIAVTSGGNFTATGGADLHAANLGIIAGGSISVTNGSAVGAWQEVALSGNNGITFYGGSAYSNSSNVFLLTNGDIRLNAGTHIYAGNDAYLVLRGSSSTLYINEVAGMPASTLITDTHTLDATTANINFTTRSAGGLVIDGAEYKGGAAGSSGGSGIFVSTPNGILVAEPGGGLSATNVGQDYLLALNPTPVVQQDIINTSLSTAVNSATENVSSTTDAPVATSTTSTTSTSATLTQSGESIGGTEGSFGASSGESESQTSTKTSSSDKSEDKKEEKKEDKKKAAKENSEGKKDEKPANKKVSQCT